MMSEFGKGVGVGRLLFSHFLHLEEKEKHEGITGNDKSH